MAPTPLSSASEGMPIKCRLESPSCFLWIVYSSKNFIDMICEDGLSRRKVVMHAGNEFKFQELSDFNEVNCKAAYKVFKQLDYIDV